MQIFCDLDLNLLINVHSKWDCPGIFPLAEEEKMCKDDNRSHTWSPTTLDDFGEVHITCQIQALALFLMPAMRIL